MRLSTANTYNILNGSGLSVANGGRLEGSGTLNFGGGSDGLVVADGGVLSPGNSAGRVDITGGALTLLTGARTVVELGGTAEGAYDVVTADVPVTIGGLLDLSVINGFTPADGNTFRVVRGPTGQAVQGAFSNVASGGTLSAGGFDFLVWYGNAATAVGFAASDVTLVAVSPAPEPASLAALAATALAGAVALRRRAARRRA
jgi:hypothetical protein